ncbi:MAG: NUDIX domain-containing protein [Bacteroidota bacterium]
MNRPRIGIGIIIENAEGAILIGKRKGTYAPYFSIPGGHLELGESFEQAAIRETVEETGLHIETPRVLCVTNNLRTHRDGGPHFVSVTLYTRTFRGIPQVMEADKCEFWQWADPRNLPQPHFDASEFAVACFLRGAFYLPGQK